MKEKTIVVKGRETQCSYHFFSKKNIENVPISNAHNISSRRLRWNVVQFFNNCIHMGPILDIFHYKREEKKKISTVLHMNCKRYTSSNKID